MSPHHFTKNTVAAQYWCNKCNANTMHRVDDGRISYCLICLGKLEDKHNERKPAVVVQEVIKF